MRLSLTLAAGLLLLSLSFSWWRQGEAPRPVELVPTLSGEPEYCLTCHAELPEISRAHPIATFGCVTCHGGERLALEAEIAHSSLRGGANPSDLNVVEASCGGGECHSGNEQDDGHHIQRVTTSVQATYAGAIASIRYTYGAQNDLHARFGINDVDDAATNTGIRSLTAFDPSSETSAPVRQFGEACLACHLNAAPREGEDFARSTGCAACHGTGEHGLTTAIPYSTCNACHNRGNYDLRSMAFVERDDHAVKRLDAYYQPIAQFTQCEYTLDCIDCHTRSEVMGDGDLHASQKDIQYIQCKTCHGTLDELPRTRTLTDPDDIAFRLASLDPVVDLQLGDTILVSENGEPLWNTRALPDGSYELIGKASRQLFSFRPVMGTACEQDPAEQASSACHECHAVER